MPLLVGAGHEVASMTRSKDKATEIEAFGTQPVVCDVFDSAALLEAVAAFAPELVMHQLTVVADEVEQISDYAGRNNRIRTEGTRNLLATARSRRE